MRKKVALLTDVSNGHHEEDNFLTGKLSQYFDVKVVSLDDVKVLDEGGFGVIQRNIWPDNPDAQSRKEYVAKKTFFLESATKKSVKLYNPSNANADAQGKQYLVDLYNRGFPVIPTVSTVEEITDIQSINKYIMKHKKGLSGLGQIIGNLDLVKSEWNDDYIIQPFLNFVEEVQFYFIDNKFVYANKTPHRLDNDGTTYYEPSESEVQLAQKFIDWNNIDYGLQRVDFCRLDDGCLLLLEIEDSSPYLWLLLMPERVIDDFINKFLTSIFHWSGLNLERIKE